MTSAPLDPDTVRPAWRSYGPAWCLRLVVTYALAALAGYLAMRAHMPLPWMLGPLFACGAATACGVRLQAGPHMREIGQVIVGLAVGMRFTPHVLAAALDLLPAMLVATLYIIAVTFIGALIMRPLARRWTRPRPSSPPPPAAWPTWRWSRHRAAATPMRCPSSMRCA